MADIDLDFLARQMERLLTEMQGMREEMGSIYAELNSMRAEMANMRDEIRALSTTVLRMDGSAQSMAQELGAISGLLTEQSPAPQRDRGRDCLDLPPLLLAHHGLNPYPVTVRGQRPPRWRSPRCRPRPRPVSKSTVQGPLRPRYDRALVP